MNSSITGAICICLQERNVIFGENVFKEQGDKIFSPIYFFIVILPSFLLHISSPGGPQSYLMIMEEPLFPPQLFEKFIFL
ncbi:hypothetical protein V1477_001511 [Vespula maculifrons]|uniref:Uncharacterized protein n=1 Tax=Vespula maculifrons TaxID=7453 RepID=A0ABD2CYP9_VESMC